MVFFSFFVVILIFIFIDMFDSIGIFVGFVDKVGMFDEKGDILNMDRVLMFDVVVIVVGSIFGIFIVIIYIESVVGIEEGGRIGFIFLVIGILFIFVLVIVLFIGFVLF